MILAGCSLDQTDLFSGLFDKTNEEQNLEAQGKSEETESILMPEDDDLLHGYELRLAKGEFDAADYREFAGLYGEKGQIRKQRDMLEQCYRLFDDQESFDDLQDIWVDLSDESEEIVEAANLMLQNMELEEYRDEAVNLIAQEEWFETMMPKLKEGRRNYYLKKDDRIRLVIQAGYKEGKIRCDVWMLDGEQVTVLSRMDSTLQFMTAQMENGYYNGVFDSWTFHSGDGSIYHETGELTDGKLTGDYTVLIHGGNEGTDAFSLWCHKEEMEYITYSGHFSPDGKTTLEQPGETALKSLIKDTAYDTAVVYAYDQKKEKCLYTGLFGVQSADDFIMNLDVLGWSEYPTVKTYQPAPDAKPTQVDESKENSVKARIYDGEVQVYVDGIWMNAGSVKELEKADPFRVYAEREIPRKEETEQTSEAEGNAEQNQSLIEDSITRVEGIVKQEETQKPATTKPATSQTNNNKPKPKPAPEPTPEPTPQPTPEPAPSPSPAPAPAPTQETPPAQENPPAQTEPQTGNDTDIEWSPDML